MADTDGDLGHWSNRQFTQVAALIMVIVGFVTADAYSLDAGIAVWAVAAVFLVGSFVIEKDLSPRLGPRPDAPPGAPPDAAPGASTGAAADTATGAPHEPDHGTT